jgi:hypothetical protein
MVQLTTRLADAIRDNGGFTYHPDTDRILTVGEDAGYAIAIPGTEYIVGDRFTSDVFTDAVNAAFLAAQDGGYAAEDIHVGGWWSPDRGYMVELTTVLRNIDRSTAITIGELRDQDAIFHLDTGEEITLTRIPV